MDISSLQAQIPLLFAPWIADLGLQVLSAEKGQVLLHLPVTPKLVHAGGVMCGQASMAAADSAMVLAMITELGEFRPMTTVQLQTTFLRPISGEHCLIKAQVLRRGKSLAFGSIDICNPDGRLAAQSSTTYALL